MIRFALAAVLALTAAGSARAGPADIAVLNAAVLPAARSTPADLPGAIRPAGRAYQPITMLKTAVAQRLTPDGLTGSLGLLCGRQPNRDISGGAGAFDQDREGKFLGAQLSRTF